MSPEEKAYIAGIVDGEGSIMLIKFHNNQFPAPCLSISSTTIELLQWLKNTTEMGTIKSKKNYNLDKHRDSFTYMVKYNNAISLIKEIEHYLVIESKRKRAKLIIKEYKRVTPRNGRYSSTILEEKENFYAKFIGIK